jgi:hypothetical protein
MTEHLSRHHVEEVSAHETHVGARAQTRRELQAQSHVLSCDVCTTRKRSIETARARFLALAPADQFARATLAHAANAPPAVSLRRSWPARAIMLACGCTALAVAAAAWLWAR